MAFAETALAPEENAKALEQHKAHQALKKVSIGFGQPQFASLITIVPGFSLDSLDWQAWFLC